MLPVCVQEQNRAERIAADTFNGRSQGVKHPFEGSSLRNKFEHPAFLGQNMRGAFHLLRQPAQYAGGNQRAKTQRNYQNSQRKFGVCTPSGSGDVGTDDQGSALCATLAKAANQSKRSFFEPRSLARKLRHRDIPSKSGAAVVGENLSLLVVKARHGDVWFRRDLRQDFPCCFRIVCRQRGCATRR
jgi:hypothetical protein